MVCPMRVDTYYNYEKMKDSEATVMVSQTEVFGVCHEWECPFYDENYNKDGKAVGYCKYYGQVGGDNDDVNCGDDWFDE